MASSAVLVKPVMLPPGRARLATSPEPTGSLEVDMTIGMVRVACFAGAVAVVPSATITSTLSRTSSSAMRRNSA